MMKVAQTICWCKLPGLPRRSTITTPTRHGKWATNRKLYSNVRAGMLQDVANTAIPTSYGSSILAFMASPNPNPNSKVPLLILIHEFWGLAPEICRKAEALADELGCIVIAPDTFRGESTRFIPKAIFLALSTPQDRVNMDLDEVLFWATSLPNADLQNVGFVGFCYGGGKAIRYATHYGRAKAVAVVYGKPIKGFEEALEKAGVKGKISVYEGQGHAFWRDMDQVTKQDGPQRRAWIELTSFLQDAFYGRI